MANLIAKRYEILKSIGHGGMADVYLAFDTILKREVAIKVLKSDNASDEISLERFRREAQASTKISHPSIVEIYDVGDEDDSHYIVMEYVKGYTLKQLLKKRGAIAPRETVWMMKQLTGALLEAHKNGLIHRDIKSQNVLIKDDGTIKLADFGIAVLHNSVQLTSKDSVLGSVHYLAPELVKGDPASMQSDIYSLGIVMFEILTGDVPFKADTPAGVALKHIKNQVPDVRTINPAIPQSVSNIVIRATARDPKERYPNVAYMLKDLIDCLKPEHANDQTLVLKTSAMMNDLTSDINNIGKVKSEIKKKKQDKQNKSISVLAILLISIFSIIAIVLLLMLSGVLGGKTSNTYIVPDVINMTEIEAKDTLSTNNIEIKYPILTKYTDSIEKGHVVSIEPSVGSEVDKSTKVVLTVSDGLYYTVKDFTGLNIEDVKKELKDNPHFHIFIESIIKEDEALGKIISQNIAEGSKLDPSVDQEFIFEVVEHSSLNIPVDLIGKNVIDVKNELDDMGFNVEIEAFDTSDMTDEERSRYQHYEIMKVDPPEGTLYYINEENVVTLYYFDK